MARIAMGAAAVAVMVAGVASAQREPLPAGCRQEILALCRDQMEGGVRQCLRAAMPKLSDPCRKAISDRSRSEAPPGTRELSYGAHPKQMLDFSRPTTNRTVPVVLFIHGGGWSIGDKRSGAGGKAAHFHDVGWAFASANYRLVPGVSVEQQAADVAAAVAYLRAHAVENGLNPDHIVLMGHSAGAHLAALVGTDPRYLAAAGVPMKAVKGVILLDGAGYDIPQQMARSGNPVGPMYDAAFGKEPGRQEALSPTRHAAAPNVARWLILPIDRRDDSKAQSAGLAAALRSAGASASVIAVPGESHRTLNRGLGEQGDFATTQVDRFLALLQ